MAGKEISLQYARNIVALKVIPEMEEGSQYYEYMIKQTLQELLSYIEEGEGTFKNK